MVFCFGVSRALTPDQSLTFISVFDELAFPIFPIPLAFFVVLTFAGVREPFDVQLKLARPMPDMTEEVADFGTPSHVPVPPIPGRSHVVLTQAVGAIHGPGRYEVRAIVNGAQMMGYKAFHVNSITMQPPQGGNP